MLATLLIGFFFSPCFRLLDIFEAQIALSLSTAFVIVHIVTFDTVNLVGFVTTNMFEFGNECSLFL